MWLRTGLPPGLNGKNGGDVGTESRFYTASTRPAQVPWAGNPQRKKIRKKKGKSKKPGTGKKYRLEETKQKTKRSKL